LQLVAHLKLLWTLWILALCVKTCSSHVVSSTCGFSLVGTCITMCSNCDVDIKDFSSTCSYDLISYVF
jgi:hypothetical protein